MAQASPLLADFAVVLGVATGTGSVARRLKQPPILGYLLAGLIVGPYIPVPLFANANRVRDLSELGVVLVMFAVGLELSLSRAAKVLPIAGLAAAMQIGGMFWAGNLLGLGFGLSLSGQVVVGAALAVSSTMVVTKVFDVHPPPDDVRGVVLGVLVLQDIVAIVLITVVTAVSEGVRADADELMGIIGNLAGVMVVGVGLGLTVVPRLTQMVSRLETPEVDTVFAVGLCFAFGGVMQWLGYSPALGAFLAGTLVAESGLSTRYEHLVAPIRDVFAAIFFVSVGMSVDPSVALDHVPETLAVAAVIVVVQAVLVTSAGVLSGLGIRRSAHAGIALGQVGEFAFIIVGIGVTASVIPESIFTVVVGAAVLTTFTTSVGLSVADRLITGFEHALPTRFKTLLSMYSSWVDGVREGVGRPSARARIRRGLVVLSLDASVVAAIIVGASLFHSQIEHQLTAWSISERVALVAVVLAAATIAFPFVRAMWRVARALGVRITEAALPTPEADVPDLLSTGRIIMMQALHLAALLAAGLLIVAVTRPFVPPGSGILGLGVVLVPAVFALWRSGGPFDEHVRSATEILFEILRRGETETEPNNPQLEALLHGLGDVTRIALPDEAVAVGKTLADLDLRARTGASVLALVDAEGNVCAPTGREALTGGMILAVSGPRAAVEQAHALLMFGARNSHVESRPKSTEEP